MGKTTSNVSNANTKDDLDTSPGLLNQRIHYLDHVRAFAMLLGVFFHAAFPYSTDAQNGWFLKDTSSSMSFTVFIVFSHLFRMALFFLIAGFFANLLIQKRGVKAFLKNRAIRILLPFVIFFPIIMAVFIFIFYFISRHLPEETLSPLLANMLVTMNNPEAVLETPTLSTAHLWFLYNLLYFCLFAAILQRFRFFYLRKFMSFVFNSGWHLLFLPLFLMPALYSVNVPASTPDSFSPQLWSYGYYGLFFFFGWHFFYHQGYLDKIKGHLWKLIIFCLITFPLFVLLMPVVDFSPSSSSDIIDPKFFWSANFEYLFLVGLEAYLSFYLVIIFLYLGKKLLNKKSKLMRYISDASYWIYLVHVPLLLYVQTLLVEMDMPLVLKFFISTALVFIVSTMVYDLLVRYSFIGSMLNGKKSRQQDGLRLLRQSSS